MDRYEISSPGEGVICFCEHRSRALIEALRLAKTRNTVDVYDRMAHIGRPELWEVSATNIKVKNIKGEPA